MNALHAIALVVAVLLFLYLIVALFRPERF
jgi:K+-transporting ATPase KdpF subunit